MGIKCVAIIPNSAAPLAASIPVSRPAIGRPPGAFRVGAVSCEVMQRSSHKPLCGNCDVTQTPLCSNICSNNIAA